MITIGNWRQRCAVRIAVGQFEKAYVDVHVQRKLLLRGLNAFRNILHERRRSQQIHQVLNKIIVLVVDKYDHIHSVLLLTTTSIVTVIVIDLHSTRLPQPSAARTTPSLSCHPIKTARNYHRTLQQANRALLSSQSHAQSDSDTAATTEEKVRIYDCYY